MTEFQPWLAKTIAVGTQNCDERADTNRELVSRLRAKGWMAKVGKVEPRHWGKAQRSFGRP
jgi:hypothetical protein